MRKTILYIIIAVLTVSCEINQKDIAPTDEFVKVYNHPNEGESYFASSIIQVPGGYLILTGLKQQGLFNVYPNVVIIKTNELGEIINTVQTNWVAPTPKLVEIGGQFGFVAMDNQYGGHFITVDAGTGEEAGSTVLTNMLRPLAANVVNNNLVVLGYNLSSQSIVSLFNSNIQHVNTSYMGSGNNYVTDIDHHLMKTGYEFPFFIGEYFSDTEKGFFVNCLSNATLSINFFNEGGNPTGGYIYEHQALYSAPSSLIHKEDNMYALTRYNTGKNFLSSTIEVDITVPQRFSDSIQNPLYELPEKARIISDKVEFNGVKYMLFTSVNQSNSIVIYQYNMNDDERIHTYSMPFNDNTDVVDVIQDFNDEGIVILARTYVTGRYIRPMVVKVSKEKFKLD